MWYILKIDIKCMSLYSSVVEHWSCKPEVVSTILTGGINLFTK